MNCIGLWFVQIRDAIRWLFLRAMIDVKVKQSSASAVQKGTCFFKDDLIRASPVTLGSIEMWAFGNGRQLCGLTPSG